VVAKAEAELSDKREQLKTVADSIDSILGSMAEVCLFYWALECSF